MDERDDDREELPAQGVRIIGAEEAAAALEAGEAQGKKTENEPRYGDRPRSPQGPRPAHRFPSPEPVGEDPAQGSGMTSDQEVGASQGRANADEPGGEPLEGHPTAQVPELPHWTDPPTGEVPAVLAGDSSQPEDDLDAWSSLPGRGPGWRDENTDWDDSDYQPSMLADDDTKMGALDESEGPDPYSLDALGAPEPEREAGRSPWTRQSSTKAPAGTRGSRSRRRRRSDAGVPGSGVRRVKKSVPLAVATGVAFGVVALVLFKLGPATSLVLALVLVSAAVAEAYAVLRRAGYRPATLLGIVATVAVMIAAYLEGEKAIPLVLALVVIFSMLWYLWGVVRARATINVAVTLIAFMWVGLLGSFAGLLLDPSVFPNRHGVAYLVGAALATVGYDIGGFVFGSLLGRHPMAPSVSPGKTWEGLVGGMVTAFFVAAVLVSQIHPWTFGHAAALGLVVAVAAPLGDLCESMVKRDIGVKDMGHVLPGHGGVLDRVDALLFVVPATYYLVQLLKLN